MNRETLMTNIKRLENEIKETNERLEHTQNSLLKATTSNIDQILNDLTDNASKLGKLDRELGDEQKKLRDSLGITKEISLSLPKEVWERLDYELKYQPNSNLELMIRDTLIHFFFPTGLKSNE